MTNRNIVANKIAVFSFDLDNELKAAVSYQAQTLSYFYPFSYHGLVCAGLPRP